MKLDTKKWDIISGLESEEGTPKVISESAGFQEDKDLARLRMIIREEVQAAFNEMRTAKDINSVETAMKDKSVGAAMGFSGPGFGGNNNSTQSEAEVTSTGRPTHGLMRGPGF
ncbi:MAG: hypothetical protein CML56_00930 [Rhodobacteraceae bacterium]|nr:hypothetical protein [Paracoccaceae bacterium]